MVLNANTPEGAKALLDEMGMDQLDEDGMRLAPGGEKFTFTLETHQATQAWLNPSAELIGAQLRDVGIRVETVLQRRPLSSHRSDIVHARVVSVTEIFP